jgi:hypothetical protein
MTNNAAIYNVRIVTLYLKLLRERYPHVPINDVLDYAGIESYEISDEGHWITQEQIDRFYERIVQFTGNSEIAREAGRIAASPGAIGIMRQYTLGLLGPDRAFAVVNKATRNLTLSSEYHSRSLGSNSVEITVRPNPGVVEKPFQCENRMGFFEALVGGFNLGMPKIDHPECLFKGGEVCRYTGEPRRRDRPAARNDHGHAQPVGQFRAACRADQHQFPERPVDPGSRSGPGQQEIGRERSAFRRPSSRSWRDDWTSIRGRSCWRTKKGPV